MKVLLTVLALLVCAGALHAASPGDEVVVVYNTRVPESKEVAEHYAQLRQVPKSQVFGFALSTGEEMSRAEFRDSLQNPLAEKLEKKKLWHIASHVVPATTNQPSQVDWLVVTSKIRYAVLCYGIPLRIAADPNVKEGVTEKLRPELQRNEAAVDSELALLPLVEQKLPLSGPLRNPLFAITNAAQIHPTNGILLVARLDGPTPAIARSLVDKALQAEAEGLWGRAYFDVRNITDPGYKLGDDAIRNAGEISRRLGFETTIDDKPETFPASFPMSQIALYVGWYDANVSGPFTRPNVEFMPGAIAYHLHSFSARSLRTTNEYWVGPLLAKGATATLGCVNEPYLSGTPDMAIFTARLLYNAFSFGEAAYASQPVLSWQTTVVGDPLYRPFGKNPEQLHDQLMLSHNKAAEWSYLRLLNLNLAMGKPIADCVALLEQLGTTKESAVLTEKLANLYAAQGKPSSAIYAYQQALKLAPTPQTCVRLRLTLGEKLLVAGRDEEAYAQYQALLRDCPDYPDKLDLYRKLTPLAQKLNKQAQAQEYQAEIDRLTAPKQPAPSLEGKSQTQNPKT